MRAWNLRLEPASFSADRSYARMVSRLYEAWARRENKPRWGDKTPSYVLEIPLLVRLFPDAKILHIYRDGRDVALSWLRYGSGPLFSEAVLRPNLLEGWYRYSPIIGKAGPRRVKPSEILPANMEKWKRKCRRRIERSSNPSPATCSRRSATRPKARPGRSPGRSAGCGGPITGCDGCSGDRTRGAIIES